MSQIGTAIGRLQRAPLREAWTSESGDFTPWLAQAENIALLGDAIGIELEVVGQEATVGPFRADLVARDTITGHYILIENQLERTDHTHLGQLITYGAGLDALTVVWIAGRFTDEHRAALDWLNRATREGFNFFGLEIELYRIGESPLAVKFNVVCQPNDWTRIVQGTSSGGAVTELTAVERLHLEFWTQFREFMEERDSPVRVNRPSKDHWTSVALGRSFFAAVAANNMRDGYSLVKLSLTGPDAKPHYRLLESRHRPQIDQALAPLGPVEWRLLPNNQESQVSVKRNTEPSNKATWPELNEWFATALETFRATFAPLVRTLDALDAVEPDSLDPDANEA